MENKPDKWVVVKITTPDGGIIYKVFASWYGGYLGADSWRMNSGIIKVEDMEDHLVFSGASGSKYLCGKPENGMYGMSSYSNVILNNMIEESKEVGAIIEIMPENTDWTSLVL